MSERAPRAKRTGQTDAIAAGLRVHPRLEQQAIGADPDFRRRVAEAVPHLVPFRVPGYEGLLPVLDWDHRLPSRALVLRVYAFHAPETLDKGERAFAERLDDIAARDRFPEFDVPDFAGLGGDEDYEAELTTDGDPRAFHFVSEWRRAVDAAATAAALQVVRGSRAFDALREECAGRPGFPTPPQVVQWVPPCEADHAAWTVDVWCATDIAIGQTGGRSFLVDPEARTLVGVRTFVLHTQ